jgi:hypothetical protein
MERREESFCSRSAVKRGGSRRKLALSAAILILSLASLLAYAKAKRGGGGPYSLADDCPRGALVYAQASDLPTLLRLWDGSRFKERYLASTNFKQFADGHVALKLVARAGEFGDALGFTPDLRALAETSEKSTAVAVYDIGRMELVIVAPVSEEKALAARFFQSAESFEKTDLPDGTSYYSRDVEANRGRQKQKILFAYARGRFVLATSEQLMLRTLANVNGRSHADRLSDDPSFKTLSHALHPHLASIWVDQSRLNADYYFKHYWAMSDASSLRGIHAGLFDFEMREGSFVERREFLLEGARARGSAALSQRDAQELSASLPAGAAYSRLRVLRDGAMGAASLVRDAVLDRARVEGGKQGGSRGLHEEFDAVSEDHADYSWGEDYSYLGGDYDVAIDDPSDSEADQEKVSGEIHGDAADARLESAIEKTRPAVAAVAEDAVARNGPLFADFRRLAIIRLEEPGGLDVKSLEESLSSLAVGRLTAAGTGSELKWVDAGEGARRRRELALPMLGWTLCYTLRGRDLFVSNDASFLDSALAGGPKTQPQREDARLAPDDLTVIRLDRRREAFDAVFDKLDAKRVGDYRAGRGAVGSAGQSSASDQNPASDQNSPSLKFFSGNVASLLDAASPVARVKIRRRTAPGRLSEEVELSVTGATEGEAQR